MMATWAQRFATAIERPAIAYGMVAGAVAAAAAVQGALELTLTAPPAFMIYFPAMIFATVVAGGRGGLAALALSALVAAAFWSAEDRAGASLPVSLGLYILTGAFTVGLAKPLRVAIRRGAAVQERFRLAQQAAKDSFVILDPVFEGGALVDFVWIYANAAADRMAPAGVESLVGRRVHEVFPDETGQDMFERLSRALTQDQPDDVEVRRIINGQEHWVRSSAMRAGGGVAVTFRDVTELRQTVETLRRGEARVRAIVESLPQLLWVSDADGAWTFASPQWQTFTGHGPGEALGEGWLDAVHPEDRDAVAEAWRQAVQGTLPFSPEFRLRRADGAWRWFHGRAAMLPDADGEVRRLFGSASDITEIVEARQDLEARVAERTRDLEASLEARARTEAALAQAQRLETVGRLTGGVAHDFNNLLTVVIGGLDMMLKDPADTARVTRMASAALAAGRRGERLTRQLLAFSRRQELRLDNLAVAPLVEQIEPLVRRAAGEAIALKIDCPPEVGAARLDAAQFEAALLNLVVNAADATPAGGEIRIEAARLTLRALPTESVEVIFTSEYSKQKQNGPAGSMVQFTPNGATEGLINPILAPITAERLDLEAPFDTYGAAYVKTLAANGKDVYNSGGTVETRDWAEIFGSSLAVTVETDALTFRSITGYVDVKDLFRWDITGGLEVAPGSFISTFDRLSTSDASQWSQELQATGTAIDDRLTWLAGVYYFRETGRRDPR
ncbi:MAG: hypothetical protein B7Z13_08105, partial [Caulobacterales bacterium 32-67-6]